MGKDCRIERIGYLGRKYILYFATLNFCHLHDSLFLALEHKIPLT
jgi:hypothetical protein